MKTTKSTNFMNLSNKIIKIWKSTTMRNYNSSKSMKNKVQ